MFNITRLYAAVHFDENNLSFECNLRFNKILLATVVNTITPPSGGYYYEWKSKKLQKQWESAVNDEMVYQLVLTEFFRKAPSCSLKTSDERYRYNNYRAQQAVLETTSSNVLSLLGEGWKIQGGRWKTITNSNSKYYVSCSNAFTWVDSDSKYISCWVTPKEGTSPPSEHQAFNTKLVDAKHITDWIKAAGERVTTKLLIN